MHLFFAQKPILLEKVPRGKPDADDRPGPRHCVNQRAVEIYTMAVSNWKLINDLKLIRDTGSVEVANEKTTMLTSDFLALPSVEVNERG